MPLFVPPHPSSLGKYGCCSPLVSSVAGALVCVDRRVAMDTSAGGGSHHQAPTSHKSMGLIHRKWSLTHLQYCTIGKVKALHLYLRLFHKYAQRRFTIISLPPADRKHRRIILCWYSFYRPREDGKLSELQRERRSARPGIEPGTYGLGGRDLTTAPTPPLGLTV